MHPQPQRAEHGEHGHVGALEHAGQRARARVRVVRVSVRAEHAEDAAVGEEDGGGQRGAYLVVQREGARLQRGGVRGQVAHAEVVVEVVGEGHAVAGGELLDFVLAVAVEGGPVDRVGGEAGVGDRAGAPVKGHGVAGVADDQLAALVVAGQADDEGAELSFRARGVDVGLEEARGGGVDLGGGQSNGSCSREGGTNVELVQLRPHARRAEALGLLRQQDLGDGVDDAELVGAKVGREGGAVHLGGLAVRLVVHVLALVAEAGRLAVLLEGGELGLAILAGHGKGDLAAAVPGGVPAQGEGRGGGDGVLVRGRGSIGAVGVVACLDGREFKSIECHGDITREEG